MNDRVRRAWPTYLFVLLGLLSAFMISGLPARSQVDQGIVRGPLMLCPQASACRRVEARLISTAERELELEQRIVVHTDAPLTLWIVAMASSEARWNGRLIAWNGRPSADAAGEIPGTYIFSADIPPSLVRRGENDLRIRMSSHHLWLPVEHPVRMIRVEPFGDRTLPDLNRYLPALLLVGLLMALFGYHLSVAATERRNSPSAYLAIAAGVVFVQLPLETARVFWPYPYPWHLGRLAAIVLLSAAASLAFAIYAKRRFHPAGSRFILWGLAAALLSAILLAPVFDEKALWCVGLGATSVLFSSTAGLRQGMRSAKLPLLLAVATIVLILLQGTNFLDGTWFMLAAVALVAATAERLRRAKEKRVEEASVPAQETTGDPQSAAILLNEGSTTHRVAASDIVSIKAAGDFSEIRLLDGRMIFVSTMLARLMNDLPSSFIRVHRSYAVNAAHVTSTVRRASGRAVTMTNGSRIPVGRTYAENVDVKLGFLPSPISGGETDIRPAAPPA